MFGNRKLKLEIVRLEEEILSLTESNNQNTKRLSAIIEENISLCKQISAIRDSYSGCEKELNEVKEKVRKQNESDLLFVSLKIALDLLKGTNQNKLKSEQDKLMNLYIQQQQAMGNSGYSSIQTMRGLLGAFGL